MAQADSIYYGNSQGDVSRTVEEVHKSAVRRTANVPPLAGNSIQLPTSTSKERSQVRADRSEKAFAALHVYLAAIVTRYAQPIPGCRLDRKPVDKLFMDVGPTR